MSSGKAPKQMIDPNTRTDYNKMKRLLQLDRLDGDRKGVIRTIAERGEIISTVEETFPARYLVVGLSPADWEGRHPCLPTSERS